MEPEGSLPGSQVPTTRPYPELHKVCYHTLFQTTWWHTDCLLFVTRPRNGRSGVRIPRGRDIFLFSNTVQTAPGVHPASYSIGTAVLPGLKLLERDADHSPPSSAQVKNEWSCNLTPHIHLHGMDRDKCNLYTYCLPLYRAAQAVCYSNTQYSTVKCRKVH